MEVLFIHIGNLIPNLNSGFKMYFVEVRDKDNGLHVLWEGF